MEVPVLRVAVMVYAGTLFVKVALTAMVYTAVPWPGAGDVLNREGNWLASVTAVPVLFWSYRKFSE